MHGELKMTILTEDQIERRVESMFDSLDRQLMRSAIDQATYDAEAHKISKWADEQYAGSKKPADVAWQETDTVTEYGLTQRLPFAIRVF
jgi:hypothetical protein